MTGCGEDDSRREDSRPLVHQPGYRFDHGDEAIDDPATACSSCHGDDFEGTFTVPSCFACHPRPGPPFRLHPASSEPSFPWASPMNHGRAAKKDLLACATCHASSEFGAARIVFDVAVGSLEHGCASVEGCHLGDSFSNGHDLPAAHPSLDPDDPRKQDLMHWYGETIRFVDESGQEREYPMSHHDAGNLVEACSQCHGSDLEGGAGPACSDCHVLDAVSNPTDCVSCHGWPTRPTAALIDAAGRRRELSGNVVYASFIEEVARGFHLAHEAIACEERDSVSDCRRCHGNARNSERHHALVGTPIPQPPDDPAPSPGEYECLTCHEAVDDGAGGDIDVLVERDCAVCHPDVFPADLPCTEAPDTD